MKGSENSFTINNNKVRSNYNLKFKILHNILLQEKPWTIVLEQSSNPSKHTRSRQRERHSFVARTAVKHSSLRRHSSITCEITMKGSA